MAQIGDLVPKSGVYTEPGVVIEKKEDGNVVIDTDPMQVNKFHRYTNTTGLTEPEKMEFNQILDQIYSKENELERINDIQTEIDRLKMDPKSKNIVQYLRNQQAHLIRTGKQLPNRYQADEAMLKR
jgi:bifunctional ADP-heptose synthase (sugar kinase/adenylyltransferase)